LRRCQYDDGQLLLQSAMLNRSVPSTRRRIIELIIAITIGLIGVWLAP
jgi:hypothetical protein